MTDEKRKKVILSYILNKEIESWKAFSISIYIHKEEKEEIHSVSFTYISRNTARY
jgi:hypothetical protein